MYGFKYSLKTFLDNVWFQVFIEDTFWTMYGFKYSLKTFLDNVWFQVFIEDGFWTMYGFKYSLKTFFDNVSKSTDDAQNPFWRNLSFVVIDKVCLLGVIYITTVYNIGTEILNIQCFNCLQTRYNCKSIIPKEVKFPGQFL